jgi:uncharacterized protein YgbK (DUF1537 family)
MPLKLACIADDITGASDLALMLASNGMSVTQILGVPGHNEPIETDAAVVALKIRTAAVDFAVEQATTAADRLLALGATQLYFKYCSTFDSTPAGNIGPVSDALLFSTGDDFSVVCPAFPANGRTIKDGILYVNGLPLAESSMQHHPLTPMTRSNLLEMMDEQTHAGASGLVNLATVKTGVDAIRQRLSELRSEGKRYAVLDCDCDQDLHLLAEACDQLKLVTAASGLAMGLPANFTRKGLLTPGNGHASIPQKITGQPVVLAGSCSQTTRAQVAAMSSLHSAILVDPMQLKETPEHLRMLKQQAESAWCLGPVLVYSSADASVVKHAQDTIGFETSAELVEHALSSIAVHLAERGASKFIVAGGETSGAVAEALQLKLLQTGPQIDVGVPWMIRNGDKPLVIAFKSGNFGQPDFFMQAMAMLPREAAA